MPARQMQSAWSTNYLEPAVLGFSYGMSNGWYNTAETHRPLGIDLTITANVVSIPLSQETFTFNPTEYSHIQLLGDDNHIPTVIGPINGPQLQFSYTDPETGHTVAAAREIGGIGLREQIGYNVVPSPMVQFGIGTLLNTDLIIRYIPEVSVGKFSTSLFGFGIKHDIKQWIPGIRRLPIDIAVLAPSVAFDNRLRYVRHGRHVARTRSHCLTSITGRYRD